VHFPKPKSSADITIDSAASLGQNLASFAIATYNLFSLHIGRSRSGTDGQDCQCQGKKVFKLFSMFCYVL
jgi:hypothetical protein